MRVCLVTPPSPFLLDQRVFPALGILKVAAVLEQAEIKVDHPDPFRAMLRGEVDAL